MAHELGSDEGVKTKIRYILHIEGVGRRFSMLLDTQARSRYKNHFIVFFVFQAFIAFNYCIRNISHQTCDEET